MLKPSRFQNVSGYILDAFPTFLKALGKIETAWYKEALADIEINDPVFISGLARAGTTILLEVLSNAPEFATHRYKDFPFLHIPCWWNWFLDRSVTNGTNPVERSHKDGIYVTHESPEAMEEILWMAFFPKIHTPHVSNIINKDFDHPGFEKFFRSHIKKILLTRNKKRYLSKCNYNITRLEYIKKLFPAARFVIPVRDPESHIASLIKQHSLFCREESRDVRIMNYMQRVGHFEFGLDVRPINTGNSKKTEQIAELINQDLQIQGFSLYWSEIHRFILNELENKPQLAESCILVPFDELCKNPFEVLKTVSNHCRIEFGKEDLERLAGTIRFPGYYSSGFTEEETGIIRFHTDEIWSKIRSSAFQAKNP